MFDPSDTSLTYIWPVIVPSVHLTRVSDVHPTHLRLCPPPRLT